jgi:hypothetical protein
MRKLLLATFIAFSCVTNAQSLDDSYYSITVGGGLTGASVSSSSNLIYDARPQVDIKSYKEFADAIKKNQSTRLNFSAHAWYNKTLGFNWTLQAGIGYVDMGFRYEQNKLKDGDYINNGVGEGRILDKSNVEKNLNYDYRFHYIDIPVWFNYELFKSKNYKTIYQFTAGFAANILVKHQLTARLDNFTIDGKDKFQVNNTGLDPRAFNMQINAGFKVIHKLDKETTVIVQPMYSMHPVSVTNSNLSVNPYSIILHAGLIIDLNKFKRD